MKDRLMPWKKRSSAMKRSDAEHPLDHLHREIDDLFDTFRANNELVAFSPAVDILEEEDHFLIKADLPGMSESDIDIRVHDGMLLLSGKRDDERAEEREGSYYRERRHGSFSRQFKLGSNVDPETIEATYNNGVLEVKLPKKEEAKPRQIKVKGN